MRNVLIITGPTASGKSEIAIQIAKKINGSIICMDSRQIYKDIDIGTAKPNSNEIKLVNHNMYDIIELNEEFNTYDYKHMAEKKILELLNQGRYPILVGGTGFYLDSLIKGLPSVGSSKDLREYLVNYYKNNNFNLRKDVKKIDYDSFNRIHENDFKRNIRVIEVFIESGRILSKLNLIGGNRFNYKIIVLDRDRKELHNRIDLRVEKMFELGLVNEIKNILNKYETYNYNSLNTIGYKETIEYIKGNISLEETKRLIKRNTRRYARRQIIYFRKLENCLWFNLTLMNNDIILKEIEEYVL